MILCRTQLKQIRKKEFVVQEAEGERIGTPMRDLIFILMLVFAVIYWMLNPGQVDSAINWMVSLVHR